MEQFLLAFKKRFSRLIIEKIIDYEVINVPAEKWVGDMFLRSLTGKFSGIL